MKISFEVYGSLAEIVVGLISEDAFDFWNMHETALEKYCIQHESIDFDVYDSADFLENEWSEFDSVYHETGFLFQDLNLKIKADEQVQFSGSLSDFQSLMKSDDFLNYDIEISEPEPRDYHFFGSGSQSNVKFETTFYTNSLELNLFEFKVDSIYENEIIVDFSYDTNKIIENKLMAQNHELFEFYVYE